jgi:hypothetical protein
MDKLWILSPYHFKSKFNYVFALRIFSFIIIPKLYSKQPCETYQRVPESEAGLQSNSRCMDQQYIHHPLVPHHCAMRTAKYENPMYPLSLGLQVRVPLVKDFAQEGIGTMGTIRGNRTKKIFKISYLPLIWL